jgi:hypothetical protein
MAMLAPGDDFNIAGPFGIGFRLRSEWKTIVVLGRRVGLATLAVGQAFAERRRYRLDRAGRRGSRRRLLGNREYVSIAEDSDG